MKLLKKIDNGLSYIWDESNFIVLFLFNFLTLTVMCTLGLACMFHALHMQINLGDILHPLDFCNRIILVTFIPLFFSLMITPMILMKRVQFKMSKIITTFESKAKDSKDKDV